MARLLVDHSFADLVFFCNSGAEANEAAIKCVRRHHQKILKNGKYEIITFEKSFHGRTLATLTATLTATGQDKVKDGFFPLPEGFLYANYNDITSVEEKMTDRTAAVMLELVQGEGGGYPADPKFVTQLADLCKKRGILLIVDEVQTGMGRTGKLFAYEHYGIEPDIVTLAKGLASGFPIGAMIGKSSLGNAFSAGSPASTFGGSPLATSAGIATLEVLMEERLFEHAEKMGKYLIIKLSALLENDHRVKAIRGMGLLIGIEFNESVSEIIEQLHQYGLLVVPGGLNVIRIMPNLYVTQEEIDRACHIISSVLFASM